MEVDVRMQFGWQQLESPLSLSECAARLQKAIDPVSLFDFPAAGGTKPVYGYVENGWIELWQRGPRNERGINALQGQLIPSGTGTIVRFRWAWENGHRWATWLGTGAAVVFSAGSLALIAFAYLGPSPLPRPYAWIAAIVPAVVAPAAILVWRRTTLVAEQQRQFLLAFLVRTLKAEPPAK